MKICPKCNTGNDDNSIYCKDCGFSIFKIICDQQDYIEELEKRKEEKHKRKMLIHNILLSFLGIVYIYIYIKILQSEFTFSSIFIGILLPLMSYLQIHHPRLLFIIGHFLTIDNIDEVELSDWYIFSTKLGGYLCLAAAFVIAIAFLKLVY
jgi:amino acid permease